MSAIFFLRWVLCVPGWVFLLESSASCMPWELIQENVEPQPQRANYAQTLLQGLKTIVHHPLTRFITERALLHALEAWSSTDLFVPLGITALVCLDLGCGRWMPHTSVLGEFYRTVRQEPGKSFGKLALTVGLKGIMYHRFFNSTYVPDLSKNTVFAVPFEERGIVPFNLDLSKGICVPQAVCGIYDAYSVVYSPRTVLDFFPAAPLALNISIQEKTSTSVPDLSKNTVFAVPFEERGLVSFNPDLSKDICVPQAVCGIYDAHPVVYSPRTVLDFFPAAPLALNISIQEKTESTYKSIRSVCASETRLEVFKPTFSAGERCSVNSSVLTPSLYALTSRLKRAASYVACGIRSCMQYTK